MFDEIIDLFSIDTESIEVSNNGVYLGKKGVERLFKGVIGANPEHPGTLTIHMQLQGIVDIDPGGKTAKGRWRCFMILAVPANGEISALWGHGEYENEYIKEDGKWRFKKLHFFLTFRTPFDDGWVKTPVVGVVLPDMLPETVKSDKPSTVFKPYPSGYIFPFHWKVPVDDK